MNHACEKALLPLGLALALLGCGGNKVNLSVTVLTPPGDDPFQTATQARVSWIASGSMTSAMMATASVAAGHFDVSLQIDSPMDGQVGYVLLEGLDGMGNAVGRGRTPNFALQASMDSSATVYVGRPGRATATSVQLVDDPRQPAMMQQVIALRDMSGTVLRPSTGVASDSLGALLVGGLDSSGNVFPNALLYDPLSQALIFAGSPMKARHGAALAPIADMNVGQQAILWGGAVAKGGMDQDPLPTAPEIFDPSQQITSIFTAQAMGLPDPGAPGAINPAVAEVQPGVFLACGGHDSKAVAVNQAVLMERIQSGSTMNTGVQRIASPMGLMAAARTGHTATPVNFSDGGPGALLFGGSASGAPMAERFLLGKPVFQPLTLMATGMADLSSRSGHVAVALQEGRSNDARVLIAGGVNAAGMLPSAALVIDPKSMMVEVRDPFLATPRQGATLSVVGNEFVICGGTGQDGKPIANCEIFKMSDGTKSRDPVSLPNARAGHLALLLETGQLLLVGGSGNGGMPLASIDIYTAP